MLELALRQHKLDDAARYVDELLKSSAGIIAGKYWKGRLALVKNQFADAMVILQDVVKEQPTLAPAHYYLGLAQLSNTKPTASSPAPSGPSSRGANAAGGGRKRIAARTPERDEHEAALAGPGGIAAADTPERIAKRVDRWAATSAAAARPRPSGAALLEKIINTADFVGIRYLDAGVAAARADRPRQHPRRRRPAAGLRHRLARLAHAAADQPPRPARRRRRRATA